MFNYLMLETSPAKEIAVAEAIDRLVGVDSSYCPTITTYRTISRRAAIKRPVVRPVLPRTVFCTASFPDREAILAIEGVEGFVKDPTDREEYRPIEVIPGWQMAKFMAEVEIYRLQAIHQEMKRSEKPAKHQRFKSLADAAQYLKENTA